MKLKIILCLALILSGWPDAARAQTIVSKDLPEAGQDFDSSLNAALPGVKLNDLSRIVYGTESRRLSATQWNQIAVAAARELSLRTTNGLAITGETVDVLLYKLMANDTPSEAVLRRLCWSNNEKVTLLRDLSNNQLINDPGVIEPLINMLEYPGEKTSIRSEAAQVLCQLTRHPYSELSQYTSGAKRSQFVKWWRDWWAKNKNRHPVFDDDVKKTIIARISALQKQLCLGVRGYGELGRLHPTWVNIEYMEPSIVADIEVDTAVFSEVFSRTTPDNSRRPAHRDQDEIFLRIKAQFQTPSLPSDRTDGSRTSRIWWKDKVEQVYREELPGTDIGITVEAASRDGVFTRRVRECLKEPSESIKAEIERLMQQLKTEKDSGGATSLLVQVGEYSSVIAALTNRDLTIQRNAVIALANFNHNAADGTSIKSAVPPLIQLLKNSDAYTRYLAAWALGHVHQEDETTVAALIVALDDEDVQTSTTAMTSLGEFKPQQKVIVPALIKKLSDTNSAVRLHAIQTLGDNWGFDDNTSASVVSAMIRLVNDSNADVRLSSITVLGRIMKNVKGHDSPQEAIRALPLRDFKSQENIVVIATIRSLSDTNTAIRAAAAYSLGDMGPFDKAENAKIVEALIKALSDKNADVRSRAATALEKFGAEAKEALPVLSRMTNQPGIASDAVPRIKGAVYKLKLDEILRQKFPRLDEDAAPEQKTDTTHWTLETNTVPGIKSPPLLMKRATFRMKAMGLHPIRPADVDFVAFKAPASGKIWIGWEMDFYVETDSTIIGGMLNPWGSVQWHEDLAEPLQRDLDGAIEQFEQRVNESKIKGESRQKTDLRNATTSGFFYMQGTGQEVMPKFLEVQVSGEKMQLSLENPETGGTAIFWIDIKTRKVSAPAKKL
ncbi:MAG: domain containing protein [Verrucomicrobiales bacterium]|nr:domain containing protein [Verrucomicrobiales bacterium]